MPLPRRHRTGGYFTPFAIVTVFAVMTVASGLVVAAAQQKQIASRAKRDLLERVSLESAIVLTADELLVGDPAPFAAHQAKPVSINGYTVVVEVSAPQGKYDLNGDEPAAITQALAAFGLPEPLREKVTRTLTANPSSQIVSFRAFGEAAKLSAGEEDCLRRWLTLGRWPGQLDTSGVGKAGEGAALRAISPGDQADIRASVPRPAGGERVLWARVRFTGGETQTWQAHDWRFLTLQPNEQVRCPS